MPATERKRCFECGASYPPDAHRCEDDQVSLWPGTISGIWRIEGVLTSRPGGATCAAFHLGSGARVAIDLVRGVPAPEPSALKALTQEIQALRLLDHPNTLRLVDEGVDRSHPAFENGDGIHFVVTELGSARPLPDLLEEWHRANGGAEGASRLPTVAMGQVGRQILGLLSAAHRLGLAHGGLNLAQIYVAADEDTLGSLQRSGAVRLHGLRALGLGPALREAIDADLTAAVAVLYELVVGSPPPRGADGSPAMPRLPSDVDGKLAQFILRGFGQNRTARFTSADEMLRALVIASPPTPVEVSAEAMATLNRTDPQANRPASSPEVSAAKPTPIDSGPWAPPALPMVSGAHGALPAPPLGSLPGSDSAVRSRFSGELKQVSFRDLVDQKDSKPGREETLARARRVSSSSMRISTLPLPSPEDLPSPAPKRAPIAAEVISSGEHASLEPTADLQALPVDFASSISGPVNIGSSMRDGRSEISLPPQPSLPPEAALPVGPPSRPPGATKGFEPSKSELPRPISAPLPRPNSAPMATTPPLVAPPNSGPIGLPPEMRPAAIVSDDSIDPLAITGQGPIPADVLSAAKRFAEERARSIDNRGTPNPPPALTLSPAESRRVSTSGDLRIAPKKPPIWLFALLGLALFGGLLALVLRR